MHRQAPIRLLLLPLLLGLGACGHKPAPKPTAAPEVGVMTLRTQAVPVSTELTGRTDATLASDVRPQVDGIILSRLFVEGSLVRAGQPLYQIDPRPYQASRDQAAATVENASAAAIAAQAQADRYRSLTDVQAVSRQDIDNTIASAREAHATVSQDRASLRSAEVNLGYTRIRAPISGRISRSIVTPGALVTANQTDALATIQQLDPIYVDIVQSSDQLLALRESLAKGSVLPARATVRLTLPDGIAYPLAGTVEFAEVTVDENSGTVTLRARMPNPQNVLLPGMFVRVAVQQGVVPNGILVPQQAISRDPRGNATALVVGPGNKVVQRTVTTSQAIGASWLVTAGLKAGDRLIVDGIQNAKAGKAVTPVATMVATPPAGQ